VEAEDRYLIATAVAELGERDQVLVVLHYLEGLSVDDIATALGHPRDAVLSGLYHARSDLRRNPELADRMSQLREFWRDSRRPGALEDPSAPDADSF
jgi:DNA-directed RNA polymerase specialized sigma24 family protein